MIEHIHPRGKLNDEGSTDDKANKHEANVVVVLRLTTFFLFLSTESIHFPSQVAVAHNIEEMEAVKKYIQYES